MILGISSWASSIVIAVIFATILEMILPEGNNKKYVKTVIGIFILFTIISPVISKVAGGNINIQNLANTIEFQNENIKPVSKMNTEDTIQQVYIDNLKTDLKNKLQEKGYIAKDVNIKANMAKGEKYGKIENISFKLEKKKEAVEEVNEINIDINEKNEKENNFTKEEYEEIKNHISSSYEISKNIINIY